MAPNTGSVLVATDMLAESSPAAPKPQSPTTEMPPEEWPPALMADWVVGLGEDYEVYAQRFVDHDVSGAALTRLKRDELERSPLGVSVPLHRLKINREWARLVNKDLPRPRFLFPPAAADAPNTNGESVAPARIARRQTAPLACSSTVPAISKRHSVPTLPTLPAAQVAPPPQPTVPETPPLTPVPPPTPPLVCGEGLREEVAPDARFELDRPVVILMVGATGTGKSTTGNKLVGWAGPTDKRPEPPFHIGDGQESVTRTVSVYGYDATNAIVIDTPGFGDSNKSITDEQTACNLVYFLERAGLSIDMVLFFMGGPTVRADSRTQEQLRVLTHYFGARENDAFWQCVVPVVKGKYLDDDDVQQTTAAYRAALLEACGARTAATCVPVLKADSPANVIRKLATAADLQHRSPYQLRLNRNICANCGTTVLQGAHGGALEDAHSRCHPGFHNKLADALKLSVVTVASLGLFLLTRYGQQAWKGTTCDECGGHRGTPGCMAVPHRLSLSRSVDDNGRPSLRR